MARFTSIGMRRKAFVPSAAEEARAETEMEAGPSTSVEEAAPKKKTHRAGRKVQRKRKRAEEGEGDGQGDGAVERGGGTASGVQEEGGEELGNMGGGRSKKARHNVHGDGAGPGTAKKQREGGWGRDADIAKTARIAAEKSEVRRVARIAEKSGEMTCFACRERGHSARECSNALSQERLAAAEVDEAGEPGGRKVRKGAEVSGGRCYRCNSNLHALSQCPRRPDPSDPTPFATCFICLGKGHLSAQCPENKKGVYVHGGNCKLCGSVRHRADDCPTRRARDQPDGQADLGGYQGDGRRGQDIGADEDEFTAGALGAEPRGQERGERKHAPAKNGAREKYVKETPGGEALAVKAIPKRKVVAF